MLQQKGLRKLTAWDTPAICNAFEIIVPERRGFEFTTEPLVALASGLPPICGFAYTAIIRPAQSPRDNDKKNAA